MRRPNARCDPAGIVYTPQFFHLFNRAIEEWFCGCLNINYYEILGPRKTGLGYIEAKSHFFTPCRMGEVINAHISVERVGTTSYSLIVHGMKDGKEAVRGRFVTVTTSLDTHRPIRIPSDLRAALTSYAALT